MSTIEEQIRSAEQQNERMRSGRAGWDASEYAGRDGVENGVFTGIDIKGQRWATWHGRGHNVEDKQVLSVEEAISYVPELALEVRPHELGWRDKDGEWHVIDAEVANVRADGRWLANVTKSYTRVQPWEAFQFIDDLLDSGDAKIATAMTMRQGRQISMLAVIPEEWVILGAEAMRLYLYLTNSYDRSTGLSVAITPVRVECTNTDNLALSTAPRIWTARHTQGITGKIQVARTVLGLVANYKAEFENTAAQLAAARMTDGAFDKFLLTLDPKPEVDLENGKGKNKLTTWETRQDKVRTVFKTAANLEAWRNTKWAALNAVTEYEDWMVRTTGKTVELQEERRMRRQLEANPIKDRALELLLT